ncbi:MAG: UDP-N-acetylmuramoyl-tripeptide--D-alanyl-D-alanine ligase [Flavobacteriales bacterium]|nr:UDP-N-acetylmuramoyl-tripeptide--D-alanyl-D-alanine ligase [Flavobacteriales bacterium]
MVPTDALHERFLQCAGACTDTRSIAAGCMFFALKGPNFNANGFAQEALAKGARFAVVDEPAFATDERCLLVHDVLAALQALARHHRRTFSIPVIGITGSNGKTTTKELIHAVLGTTHSTLATSGNLNNHIGVPLTLLRLSALHRFAIIEMGANKPGDIAELCALAEPTFGLITNIGKAHLEGFGGFEGVLRTKTELYQHIAAHGGTLFVNADDPVLQQYAAGMATHTYGTDATSSTSGRLIPDSSFLAFAFTAHDGREHMVRTKLIGAYNLPNALAAVAIGQHFGVPDDRIAAALSEYEPGNNRSQSIDTGRNQVILDAYNANPTSMAAALENFAALKSNRPKLVVLGDMLELGAHAPTEHQAIIELVERLGLEARFVGPFFSREVRSNACYATADDLRNVFEREKPSGRCILIKGSRGIKLETILPAL